MIKEVIKYSGQCPYCNRDMWAEPSVKEAEQALERHMVDCPNNPDNEMCGSCKHYPFINNLTPQNECYHYGADEDEVRDKYGLCNYVSGIIKASSSGCIYYKQESGTS